MYKKIILVFILSILGIANAQNPNSDGVYSTSFGNVTLTTEYGSEFPGGFGITYGDYKDKGTITGSVGGSTNSQELTGTFYNGAVEGKFIFLPKNKDLFKNTFSGEITGFTGFWGYNSDNKYSSNPNDKWDGTRTQKGVQVIQNVTNVWSGKWNTTDGAMYLNQVANRIVGTYKGIRTIKANYNPSTRILKGTFTNNNFNKTGYLEFYFEGNMFKGKWGWTTAMTEGNWDGTKNIKNNKELSKASASNSTSSQANSSSQKEKYRIAVSEIDINASELPIAAASQYWWYYGFAGIKIYRVTNSGREEIKSFGNKSQYFFEKTEDNAFENNSKTPFTFSETPEYYRDFEINKSDLNNPNVKIEVELWHHIKVKVAGPNGDYEKVRETLTLERLIQLQNFTICKICGNGAVKNGKGLYVKYIIKKV